MAYSVFLVVCAVKYGMPSESIAIVVIVIVGATAVAGLPISISWPLTQKRKT